MDELREGQRPAVLSWLRELTDLFPDLRYAVTTRPGAVEKTDFDDMGFTWAALEPMEPALIQTFVGQWHSAMREWQTDEQSRQRLAALSSNLVRTLDDDRFLSDLANTPLLAGLICALSQHLAGQLPRRRSEIFEKALAMFYERDRKRGIRGAVTLDLGATSHLLGELALRLVRGGLVEVDEESARRTLQRAAATLPNGPYDGAELYRHLLLRSGLLREPTSGCVDFVHRTFQEYLAARALVESDDIPELVKNADDDQWREVVILAAGQANIKQTTNLLRGLLRADWRGRPRSRRRLLAVTCLDEIHGADSDVLAAVERAIPELIPPRSMDQAEALSHAGDRLIPHLARVQVFTKINELEATVRAATLIGGPNALHLISDIARANRELISRGTAVAAEFMRSWNYFEPENYAERVLAPLEPRYLQINHARLLPALRKIPTLQNIVLDRCVDDSTDLPVLDGTQLSEMQFVSCKLSNLDDIVRSCQSVRSLSFSSCRTITDISALPLLSNLESLNLAYCSGLRDLSVITQLKRLRTLWLQGTKNLDLNLAAALPLLTDLVLSHAGQVDLAPLAEKKDLDITVFPGTEISGVGPGFRPKLTKLKDRSLWPFR